jgi:peptidoglycan/LPS O-acetylase OafA/YrhL
MIRLTKKETEMEILKKIDVYNLAKIIGLLLITACHVGLSTYGNGWPYIHSIGRWGVNIFVCVSGYGIYASLSKNPKYLDFLKRRFSKIVIPYYVVLAVSVLLQFLSNGFFDMKSLLANVFFIHNLHMTTEVYPSVHLWYTGMIMQLYLLAPLLFKIIDNTDIFGKKLGLLVQVLWLVAIYNIVNCYDRNGFFFYYRSFLYYIPIFLAGMLIKKHTNFRKGKLLKPLGDFTWYLYLANLFYAYPVVLKVINQFVTTRETKFIAYTGVIIVSAFAVKFVEKMVRKLLTKKGN